jgi:hypothetical protein
LLCKTREILDVKPIIPAIKTFNRKNDCE